MSTPRLTDHELDALLETALKVVRQAAAPRPTWTCRPSRAATTW